MTGVETNQSLLLVTSNTRVSVWTGRSPYDQRWRVLLVLSEWTTTPSPMLDRTQARLTYEQLPILADLIA
jgi:hypothetical protein